MKLTSGHSAGATATRRAEIASRYEYPMLNAIANGAKVRRSEVERTEKLAKYADELVEIADSMTDTADTIRMIESEPARIGALMDSRDWRVDEMVQLNLLLADLRARIGGH